MSAFSSHPSRQTEEGSGPVGGERESSGSLSAGTAEKHQLQSQMSLHRRGGVWPAQGGPQNLSILSEKMDLHVNVGFV